MKISIKIIVFNAFLAIFSLSSCGGLTSSDTPANQTWWLLPYTGTVREAVPETAPLVTLSVSVVPGLDNNRIQTLSADAELNQYTAARWADNLPELVASLVGRTLESSGRFEVAPERVRAASEECELQLEVREFFAERGGDGRTSGVRVAMSGRYQCEPGEAVPIRLSASVPVHDERMSVIVAAFQQALDSAMKELLENLSQ